MTTTPTVWKGATRVNTNDSGASGRDQYDSQMVQLGSGLIAIMFTDNSGAGASIDLGTNIMFQGYDARGVAFFDNRQIHPNTLRNDRNVTVETLADGNAAVAFESRDINTGDAQIIVLTFENYDGMSWTTETLVAPIDGDTLQVGGPSIAVNDDGTFQVAYQAVSGGGSYTTSAVITRSPVTNAGEEFLVGGSGMIADGQQHTASADLVNDNNVFVTRYMSGSDAAIVHCLRTPDNDVIGTPIIVGGTANDGDEDTAPAVAALTGGGFVVAWQSRSGSVSNIHFQRVHDEGYALGGVVDAEPDSGGGTDFAPAIVGLDDGGFFIAWRDNDAQSIKGQRFSATGEPVGAVVTIIAGYISFPGFGSVFNLPTSVALERLQDGRIGVTWTEVASGIDDPTLPNNSDVYFSVLDPRDNVLTYGSESSVLTTRVEATVLDAGDGDDTVYGREGADTIRGQGGHDTLDGGGGIDTLFGGTGDDTFIVTAEDVIHELAGEGTDTVRSTDSHALGAELEHLSLLGTAAINGTGNGKTNILIGNSGANVLNGLGGADVMVGRLGSDQYYVDNAGDAVIEAVGEGTADRVFSAVNYILPGMAEIELFTTTNTAGAAAINLTGNGFAQTIHGNAGANVLNGGAAADTMQGFAGNDQYFVDNIADIVIEGAGQGTVDRVFASVNYVLGAGAQIELLTTTNTAGIAPIELTGNGFAQTMHGNAGDNFLDGGGGADIMVGFAGNDAYVVDSLDDVVVETAHPDDIDSLFSHIDYVLPENAHIEFLRTANTLAIDLTGNSLSQWVYGNIAANVINGAGGGDRMAGFAGNDTFYVDNIGDIVEEGVGEGAADRVLTSISYTLGAAAQVELFTTTDAAGTGAINLTGNQFVQSIGGNAGANILDGKGGADTMSGFAGNDWYHVDNVGDVVVEGAGQGTADRVLASVSYTLGASAQIELFTTANTAGAGAINLSGNGFAQTMHGNAGANVLDGRGGADTMTGFAGNDQYYVDNAGDVVVEGAGQGTADRVFASVSYTLGAAAQIELFTTSIAAGTATLVLTGNGFAQTVGGNAGVNVINGGGGSDTLVGFAGADTFFFDTALGASNIDAITDFTVLDDTIRLENAIFTGLANGALSLGAFNTGAAATQADDRIIYNTTTGALIFDADGLNGAAGIQFATLGAGLGLSSADFFVV